MIQGKTPEITIKFNSLPELPTEGKKVTLGACRAYGKLRQTMLNFPY